MTVSSPQGAAAFFDLDKTVLSTSASLALRHALVSAGLINRQDALRNVLVHLPYLLRGADVQRMQHISRQLLKAIEGWDPQRLEAAVTDSLPLAIDPVVFREASELIAFHHSQGHPVVIASASIEQMVRPIAQYLGADYFIASRGILDEEGAFTGELSSFNYLDEKAQNCAAMAAQHGWSMADSFAYSDSITDLPLLEAVGIPSVVNPDAALRAVARERGWPVLSFRSTQRRPLPSPARAVPLALGVTALGGLALGIAMTYLKRRAVPVA